MTQEEKQLLLKDLCARLPYKVKVEHTYIQENNGYTCEMSAHTFLVIPNNEWLVKPYLRPMSSMTKDEIKEFGKFCVIDEYAWRGGSIQGFINQAEIMQNGIDWLNSHYFDYRGLIEKGLALEAPEGMYNF